MDKIEIIAETLNIHPGPLRESNGNAIIECSLKEAETFMQEFSDLTNKSLLDRIAELEREKWISVDNKTPDVTGIFLVTQDLQDNQPPITWALIFNRDSKTWTIDDSDIIENNVIAWRELPAPMNTNFKQEPLDQNPVSLDEFERVIYGQCTHGENMANCLICNQGQ